MFQVFFLLRPKNTFKNVRETESPKSCLLGVSRPPSIWSWCGAECVTADLGSATSEFPLPVKHPVSGRDGEY